MEVKKTENGRVMWHVWETTEAHTGFLGARPEGTRPFGRPRHGWENNIKMDFQEVEREGVDWIDLTQDRDIYRFLVNAVMNLRVT